MIETLAIVETVRALPYPLQGALAVFIFVLTVFIFPVSPARLKEVITVAFFLAVLGAMFVVWIGWQP